MAEQPVTHQLAAILYADVCGYSRLTAADEIGTHRQLSASLDLFADRIGNAGGEVVHYAGDAVLARFHSVVAATNCAIGIQSAIANLNMDLDEEQRLLFRVGINLGEVIVDRNDIYGDGVNLAARLESIADPGGVCISESVYREVQDKVHATFDDMGPQTLKNIERPIQAYRVVPDAHTTDAEDEHTAKVIQLSRFTRLTGPATEQDLSDVFVRSEPPSIMLLPFKNLSGNPDHDALVEGFRLAIQSSLVKLPGLFLINAPAARQLGQGDPSPVQVGVEAGVRYVIDGAVQISGDRVRTTVQLTDAPEARIVWSDRYDRNFDDIFDIQDEVTSEVIIALDVKLLAGDDVTAWWAQLPDREIREIVLRGMSHLYMGSSSGNAIARQNFEEVLRLLPDSPQALALVALTHTLEVMRGWSEDAGESMAAAGGFAEKAVELGDPDGFAHFILASVRLLQGRHDDALALSEKAATVRISCPMARGVYSNVLHFGGENEKAIKNVKAAIKFNRIYPPWMANILAASYRDIDRFDASILVANEALRLDPENLDALVLVCTSYVLSNAMGDARKAAEDILKAHPLFSITEYAKTQPYKDGDTLRRIAQALRDAGLPD